MGGSDRPHEIRIKRIDAQPIAVLETQAHSESIGDAIGRSLPVVEQRLKDLSVTDRGQPVVIYFDDEEGRSFFEPPGLRVYIGWELARPLPEANDRVRASSLPAGRVASALHIGPYQELCRAHDAVRKRCSDQGLAITGVNWERYGDHHEDPQLLRTEVLYALAE